MGRLPFPDYNTQSYYVSRSYVTNTAGCKPNGKQVIYCGEANADHSIQCGAPADNCADARSNFCYSFGVYHTCYGDKEPSQFKGSAQIHAEVPATPTHSGEISDTKTQLSELHNQYMNSPVGAKLGLPDPSKLFSGGSGGSSGGGGGSGGGPCDKDPATGCCNCGSDWYNPAQWACQIQKAGCEFSSVAGKGLGDFGQYLPYIAIGGAAILLIVLVKR